MKFPLKAKSNFSPLSTELLGASKTPWGSYTATKNFKYEDYVATGNNSQNKQMEKVELKSNTVHCDYNARFKKKKAVMMVVKDGGQTFFFLSKDSVNIAIKALQIKNNFSSMTLGIQENVN